MKYSHPCMSLTQALIPAFERLNSDTFTQL